MKKARSMLRAFRFAATNFATSVVRVAGQE
jgi:hypothetical protein